MKVRLTIRLMAWYLIGSALLFVNFAVIAANAVTENPEQVIQKLQSSLLQVMREGEKLGYEGRFKFLEPVIDQSHDTETIIKTILGATYWSQLDSEQKKLVVDTFRQLSIATYAGRFTHHDGEQFEVIEQRDLP